MAHLRKLDEEVNILVRTQVERHPIKKRQNVFSSEISKFSFAKLLYKKDEMQQKQFFGDFALLIVKNHLPIHFLESPWLKRFTLQLYPCIVFPFSKKQFTKFFAKLGSKNKRCLCFTKIFSMYVNYCMF
jgi:hypothetical protein